MNITLIVSNRNLKTILDKCSENLIKLFYTYKFSINKINTVLPINKFQI